MPHDHGHAHIDPQSGDRRVSIAIWANGLLTVAQIVGGILSGSLALIADALHNFSDMASLVIAFFARKIARRPADKRMTFGYLRIHGTPSPRSIGGRASSGCVRMVMAHINDLYPNVAVGSTAFLYSAEDSVTARS